MSATGQQTRSATRPGSFGFPVAIARGFGARTGASANRILRFTNLQAGALAALLALQFVGPWLSGSAATIVACFFILLFGLPHGTLDLAIIRRERGASRIGMSALLSLYLGLAAAMAVIWHVAPVAALTIFLIVAVVHFAEDWAELRSQFLAQGMAIALLAAPALLHLTELERLFMALTGHSEAAQVANFLLLLAPMSVAVASVSVWTLWRMGFPDQAVVGALMVTGMILLPPVIGFALFFCLYHSPRHLGAALSRVARGRSAWRIVVLLTLAGLGIAAALFAGAARADLSAQVVAASFMTLSLLTIPHMIVPAVVAGLIARRSSARPRRARTIA